MNSHRDTAPALAIAAIAVTVIVTAHASSARTTPHPPSSIAATLPNRLKPPKPN